MVLFSTAPAGGSGPEVLGDEPPADGNGPEEGDVQCLVLQVMDGDVQIINFLRNPALHRL